MAVRVRFAPSPTGDLHEGGAMVAIANDLLRRREGGAFVLRIDDTDVDRAVAGAEARIAADLAWLGIAVDETVRQSERADAHRAAADALVDAGAAVRGADGAVALPALAEDAVVEDASRGAIRIPADELGATVLVRADGRPTYHLANAVDDRDLGITDVLRGEDHIVNTARQLALCAALGCAPPRFAHLPIVVGADGARLSGRTGAVGIADLRAAGWQPAAVVDWLARSACPPLTALPAADAATLAAHVDPARLGHGTTRPDPALLATLGRDHMALLDPASRAALVLDRMEADPAVVDILAPGLDAAANAAEAVLLVRAVLDRPAPVAGDAERAAARALLDADLPAQLDADAAAAVLAGLGAGKRAVRRVLTAADHGIPLPLVLAALPREEIHVRARNVIAEP